MTLANPTPRLRAQACPRTKISPARPDIGRLPLSAHRRWPVKRTFHGSDLGRLTILPIGLTLPTPALCPASGQRHDRPRWLNRSNQARRVSSRPQNVGKFDDWANRAACSNVIVVRNRRILQVYVSPTAKLNATIGQLGKPRRTGAVGPPESGGQRDYGIAGQCDHVSLREPAEPASNQAK